MYLIEGNIGVGKSTFLKTIQKYLPQVEVIQEPLETWANKKYGQSLLEEFYKDTARWAYTIEILAMMSRVRDYLKVSLTQNPLTLMERSVYSGHYCFAKNDYFNKHLTNLEWNIYNSWVDFIVKKQCKPPLGFIYLKATPEVCYKRILKRGRKSEKRLTLDYLKQVDYWHDKFLLEKEDIFQNIKNVPVLLLDCNGDFLNNMSIIAEKLNSFILNINKAQEHTNILTY